MLQVIAGTRTFDARQRLAGDVTGNGTLSLLDAANIPQRQVGLLPRFSAAIRDSTGSIRSPAPGAGRRLITPQLSTSSCRRGDRLRTAVERPGRSGFRRHPPR
ncbi:MAG: hypothetical protein U0802_24925 [Candidatus Binatia bacterium]